MSIKKMLISQFRKPHGLLGRLAGFIMATRASNIERNERTLEFLEIQPSDRVLEIGFGPGVTIQKIAKLLSSGKYESSGKVIGIDHSEEMYRQATVRNAKDIEKGVVELQVASVEKLPELGGGFDKIFSSNVFQFWEEPTRVFEQLKNVLNPGGLLATTYMPRNKGATNNDAYSQAKVVKQHLVEAGFNEIQIKEIKTHPVISIIVIATN